jgi:nucleotide-binding universal stress UspA family protein
MIALEKILVDELPPTIDLIVTSTNGRGAVAHLLMGSVAERLVRTAPCPVLTVRHPEREFVTPDALAAVARAWARVCP